jgi:hypothetical protein
MQGLALATLTILAAAIVTIYTRATGDGNTK